MPSDGFLRRQPKTTVTLASLAALGLIGAIDLITGWELSISLLYSVAVLFAAWYGSRNLALLLALLSAATWWWANRLVHPYSTTLAYTWAGMARLANFTFVAIGGSALKSREESNLARMEAFERARNLEHEITRVREYEQRRIGQDLHDGICQMMAATVFSLSSVRDDLREKVPQAAAALDEVVGLLRDTISETRNLARGMFPIQMEQAGLPAVLDDLVSSIRRLVKIQAVFQMHGEVRIEDRESAMHLYRIAQEALSNAVEHGKATDILVTLREDEGFLQLQITDDGSGLSARETAGPGMGLKTMDYRARLMGAGLTIQNNATRGVTVTCTFRLNSGSPDRGRPTDP